jgi:hypothetical protein
MKKTFWSSVSKGSTVSVKYPKHGTRNILKRHEGVVDRVGLGPNGGYLTVRSADGQYRTLRADRMIDPSVVS